MEIRDDIQLLRRGVQVVVGTCGRLADLVKHGHLKTDALELFVLDEADKLMEDMFVENIK